VQRAPLNASQELAAGRSHILAGDARHIEEGIIMKRDRLLLAFWDSACITGILATAAMGCGGAFADVGASNDKLVHLEFKAPPKRPVTLYRMKWEGVRKEKRTTITTYSVYQICTSPCSTSVSPQNELYFDRQGAPESSHFNLAADSTAVVSPGSSTGFVLSVAGIMLGGAGVVSGGIFTTYDAIYVRHNALMRSGAVLGVSVGLLAASIVGLVLSRTSYELTPQTVVQTKEPSE